VEELADNGSDIEDLDRMSLGHEKEEFSLIAA
jgi:hypothetical protein